MMSLSKLLLSGYGVFLAPAIAVIARRPEVSL